MVLYLIQIPIERIKMDYTQNALRNQSIQSIQEF